MNSDGIIDALERIVVRGGGITTRALTEVHPETRGLTVSQYRGLVLVAMSDDGLRIGELARLGRTSSQTATRLAQRLEQRGLVRLDRGAQDDRRATTVRVTTAGAKAWSEISARRRAHITSALDGVDLPGDAGAALDAVADAFVRYGS